MNHRSATSSVWPSRGGEIFQWTKIGLDGATRALHRGLFDLEAGERPRLADSLGGKVGPRLALLVGERHGRPGSPFARGGLYRLVDLSDPPVEVGYDTGLHRDPRIDVGRPPRNRRRASKPT